MSLALQNTNSTYTNSSLIAAAVCLAISVMPGDLAAEGNGSSGPDPFDAAVKAVKSKNFGHAFDLFEALAQDDNHDAQFNLAVLLRQGKGRPQHFTKALEWALLAQLGGVTRAKSLSDEISILVTPNSLQKSIANVDAHLKGRLERGERRAVMQYVVFNQSILPTPDLETAYLWSLIGAALGIANAILLRDNIVTGLDPETIEATQDMARSIFEDQNMTVLFASSDN